MDFTLNVFTLNCWGIPFISKNRKERVQAIAQYLVDSPHTIVCLQEVWSEHDYVFFKEKLKIVLPYSHYFYSGVLGSGLCVFTKWPIIDVFFHQWSLNGYIHKIHHGDWFGGKGVGLCRVKCDDKLINVYCTHLHAEYHVNDIYLAHRVLQAYSAAEFVNLTTSPADVSILAGDLNTGPGDLAFRLITQIPALLDPYEMNCEGTDDKYVKNMGTSDCSNNSYSDPKRVAACPEGKRIDHILFHVNSGLEATVVNFGNPLKDRVDGETFSYSDHNAVSLVLRLKRSPVKGERQRQKNSKDVPLYDTVTQAIQVCREAQKNLDKSKRLFLTVGGLIFMFLLGTVGFWPNRVLYDIIKICLTGVSFYYIFMGTLWNRIEMNSVKAGFSALDNFTRSKEMMANVHYD